jgi:hypothetical protein
VAKKAPVTENVTPTCSGTLRYTMEVPGTEWRTCGNTATRVEDGKPWCGIHAPSAARRREKKHYSSLVNRRAWLGRMNVIDRARAVVVKAAETWTEDQSAKKQSRLLVAVQRLKTVRGY